MRISSLSAAAALLVATGIFTSCGNSQFHISGTVTEAKDSMLYLENMSLTGPVAVDSARLDESGEFAFSADAAEAPEFYRLRIAGQIVNIAIDSTETVTVSAKYPTMSSDYEVKGSGNCEKIRELAYLQMGLQARINALVADPTTGVDSVRAGVARLLDAYKQDVKTRYIYREPMRSYSYYALFQTYVLGGVERLVFNPRSSADDVRVFAAVATSWDTFWPAAERGKNLHNIALAGIKDQRILRSEQQGIELDASKVSVTGVIDLRLADNKGVERTLSQLAGKVVFLDFHLFSAPESMKRIMMLRDLYNKYHAQGLEIYQVSVDGNEHFWKTQTAALPWICVRDASGNAARAYNVQGIPSFFLIDRSNSLYKRAEQVQDLEAEIKSLL